MVDETDTARLAAAIAEVLDRRERSKPPLNDMQAIEDLVKRTAAEAAATAANTAVTQTLISFGLDPTQRNDILRDLMFLRDMRTLSSDSKKHVLLAVLSLIATGMVGALWIYAKSTGKMPQ